MPLIDRPLRDLLTSFSSSDPTPGGGSASALASAVGASLLMMVGGMPKTRSNAPGDRAALDRAVEELTILRRDLADAVDADTAAYDLVVGAYRLPKTSADEQQARKAAIQRALRSAIDVPLGVMRLSHRALSEAAVVAAHGHRAAASDVGVAVALLQAGAAGARLNVDINLQSVGDVAYAEGVRAELATLAKEIPDTAAAVQRALQGPPPTSP
jgi:formiminotetrahydrofolate cyclodeaminase